MTPGIARGGPRLGTLVQASGVLWVALTMIGFGLPNPHPHFDVELIPSFAAILGLVAPLGIVQLAAYAGEALLDTAVPEEPDSADVSVVVSEGDDA